MIGRERPCRLAPSRWRCCGPAPRYWASDIDGKADRDALLIRGSGWRGGDGRGRAVTGRAAGVSWRGRPGGRDRRDRRIGGRRRPGALRRSDAATSASAGARRCRRAAGGAAGASPAGPLRAPLDGAGGRLADGRFHCPGERGLHRRGAGIATVRAIWTGPARPACSPMRRARPHPVRCAPPSAASPPGSGSPWR